MVENARTETQPVSMDRQSTGEELPVTVQRQMYRLDAGQVESRWDEVVTEYPLTLYLNGEELATLVCSPCDLNELVVGFLASEGIVSSYLEVLSLSFDMEQGFCYVQTREPVRVNQQFYNKRYVTSCCGKGRQSFYFFNDARTAKVVQQAPVISARDAARLIGQLQEHSRVFAETGGVHNAALCSPQAVIAVRTDIGRHNALDKLYGHSLIQGGNLEDKVIAFSGRISSEVLLKVAKIGVGVVLSKSAPTELALQMAEELGITAIGFIRGERLNVYTHPENVLELQGK